MDKFDREDVASEFDSANIGNIARTRRLKEIARRIAAQPEANLPQQMIDTAGLEGAYRLLENEDVDPQAVLDAHISKTGNRIDKESEVLVIHDTTDFTFPGETQREGLGYLSGKKQQGFFGHFSIAATRDGQPLGTLNIYAWNRTNKPAPAPKGKSRKKKSRYDPTRESLRWGESALECVERTGGNTELIHVMDREGDCLELLALLLEYEQRFVIRLSHNRRLSSGRSSETTKLFERLSGAPTVFEREVVLSKRGKSKSFSARKRHPPRERRNATLAVRAQTLEIFPGNGASANVPTSLTLNFVDVEELNPPKDCEPVRWRIVTTEPITTPEQIAEVVDIYRMRWLIEEFFKAIKTGCRYEKRQLRKAHALLIDLAIECVVSFRLMLLRYHMRSNPDEPAIKVLTKSELCALQVLCGSHRRPLPSSPTVFDVLNAIAQLGGHIKHHGPPGWLVLRRGFSSLAIAERMWVMMNKMKNSIDD